MRTGKMICYGAFDTEKYNIMRITDWSFLIYAATATQFIGFMFRDQIIMRFALLVGTFLYIAYYFLEPQNPLWDAIYLSAILGIVNISVLLLIIFDKFSILQSKEERILYRMFYNFSPGGFRKLMAAGQLKRANKTTQLVHKGKATDILYFVIDNKLQIEKTNETFDYMMPGVFVGEVVYLSGGIASATVSIPVGTSYIAWQHAKLKKLTKKNPELKINLRTMLIQDMARKIRNS